MPIEIKPQSHLINILKSTRQHHPNFALMLGAGASATSGVRLVRDILKDWREKFYEMYKEGEESREAYLSRQYWYNKPEEYSILFEKLYDQPSQRREFIETCIMNAKPSWGYIYMVNLLRNRVFNTVFTTNFDDLLNEACYLFSSEVRPIVCAHDSSIGSVRISSSRPKIIKLHGDFLFDNIKNTIRELETLEQNTQDKFKQFANEFGFIFVGYAGQDRSIIDTLNTLLKFDQYFPHGIYWCVRKGSEISEKVDTLTRFPRFKVIEIEGFDEFSADVHSSIGLELQPEMSDPYGALANRLNQLMENINVPQGKVLHKVLEKDIRRLGAQISKISNYQQQLKEGKIFIDIADKIVSVPIPYGLLATINTRNKRYDVAFFYALKEFEKKPTHKLYASIFSLMFKAAKFEYEEDLFTRYINDDQVLLEDLVMTNTTAVIFMANERYDKADLVLDKGLKLFNEFGGEYLFSLYVLNKMLIKKLRGECLSEAEITELEKLKQDPEIREGMRCGLDILTGSYEEAEIFLTKYCAENKNVGEFISYPIFDLILAKLTDENLKQIFAKRDKQHVYYL